MKQAYLSFLNSLSLSASDRPVSYQPCGLMLHDTHRYRFAACSTEKTGLLLTAFADKSPFEGLGDYIDGSVIPGAVTLRGNAPEAPTEESHVFSAAGEHAVLSARVVQGGVRMRQTVFTFDGGIAVLGCDLSCDKDGEEPMPVFEIGLMRSFAHPDKMKVYKNTTTHGGLIVRTLMDEVKVVRHIRPTKPIADAEGEQRNIFTLALQTSPLMPCFAYEITTAGMGYGCQILSNNESCQAILLNSGEILNFAPQTGILTHL